MKVKERVQAVEMRKQGMSFNEISAKLGVSKSTLNRGLDGIELTEEQKQRFRRQAVLAGRRWSEIWRDKHDAVFQSYSPPLANPRFMLGLGLYWGEGAKSDASTVSITNSDPDVLRVFLAWMEEFFPGEYERMAVCIHHHRPEEDERVRNWWSAKLGLDLACFRRSCFAVSRSSKRCRHLEHGTARINIRGMRIWIVRWKIKKALAVVAGNASFV